MNLQKELVSTENLYRVGYLSGINKYVMCCVVPWIAWYERCFEITESEYKSFGSKTLDDLAKEFCNDGVKSHRFLFSEKSEENTKEGSRLRKIALADDVWDSNEH